MMRKKERLLVIIAFGTLAALILMMMVATVLERFNGTDFAFRWVYHHPVFFVLWAALSVAGIGLLISRKLGRQPWTLLLHLSFVVILAGALTTHLTGEDGLVRLPRGEEVSQWERSDGSVRPLPCPMTLEAFQVLYYTGSRMPSDYRSVILVQGERQEISMNNIARIDGYRFYQADYDDEASILSVNHDPWGIGITYTGYILLLLSMLGFFFQRNTVFRSTLKRIAQSSALAVALLLPGTAHAQERPKALPQDVADAFGELYIYYNDRICPFETQARDYTLKAYGKSHWKGYDACQVMTGWLFYYDWWNTVPFKLKDKERGTAKEEEKSFLVQSVAAGEAWKLYPVADSLGVVHWYTSNDVLPAEVVGDYDRWVFIRKAMDLVEQSVREENWEEVRHIVGRIRDYQVKVAGPVLPSKAKIDAEKAYNRLSRPLVPFMASIAWGLVLFILLAITLSRNRPFPGRVAILSACLAGVLLLYLTLTLGLRWFVSGQMPFAGSYCVMMLMAWLSALTMCLLWKKIPMVLPLGFLVAGFTMLMASLASANPRITHLMPVLQSPLLSIHVLSMMLAYTLLGMVALNGTMALFVPRNASLRLMDVSLVVLYPAIFLLVFGTFIGAVWANISWGTYWGWDPKETWALITFLVYSFVLHGTLLKPFSNPRFFHGFCILAFLCVLVTYFGVNLLLGGMHAYG